MAGKGAFWLFAGCNGAGKSTFLADATGPAGPIAGVRVLNPDVLTKNLLENLGYDDYENVPTEVYSSCFKHAAAEMERTARNKVRAGETLCIETVLSTVKYLPLVSIAEQAGVPFYLVYIALDSPELAQERVARRVRQGGHPVPADKIVDRYFRSMVNLGEFACRADRFWVYDNSDSDRSKPPALIAEGRDGQCLFAHSTRIPELALILSFDDPELYDQ